MKKGSIALVLAATMLLTACGAEGRKNIQESCEFLKTDVFQPTGNAVQQARQKAEHYRDVAKQLDPSIAAFIETMAGLQEKIASSSTGIATPEQQKQLTDAFNSIGKICPE